MEYNAANIVKQEKHYKYNTQELQGPIKQDELSQILAKCVCK